MECTYVHAVPDPTMNTALAAICEVAPRTGSWSVSAPPRPSARSWRARPTWATSTEYASRGWPWRSAPEPGAPLRILTVTSEAVPFAKTGGLADVCGSLPRALASRGHDVRVVLPRYGSVPPDTAQGARRTSRCPTGAGERWCLVLEGTLGGSDVPVYFLEHDALFDRPHLYGPPGDEYGDNCLRFTVLCRGALQLCRKLGWVPDVVHCHDWQAALVPALLNTVERSALGRVASVLTIHNVAYQGRFWASEMAVTGLPPSSRDWRDLEFHGGLNLLKGGIAHATLVSTVSPRYAREIQTPAFGELLDAALRARGDGIRGVLNGIDDELWDPSRDGRLVARYGPSDTTGKSACKADLQAMLGLAPDPHAVLAGFSAGWSCRRAWTSSSTPRPISCGRPAARRARYGRGAPRAAAAGPRRRARRGQGRHRVR